ncbi:MAG: hypothetical protein NT059_04440 [Planctomycetota bacterium]|nr:hypothetical protein [Planctomycetota bacterium]
MTSTIRSVRAETVGTDSGSGTFEEAAAHALERLRSATAATIKSAGAHDLNSLALSRKLGIDKSLSWRMVRFVEAANAFSASDHLPGDAGLRIFARAIRASGAAANPLAEFDAAIDELEGVVARHAGNRTAFRALLTHCTELPHADNRAAGLRRGAHEANAALWGIQAHTRLMMAFLTAGEGGTVDVALVSGFLGLRRSRRDLSWPVARRRVLGHEGRSRDGLALPLDPSVAMDAAPMLSEYSTIRGESLRPVGTDHGFWYELPEGDIGLSGAVNCVFGERLPSAGPVLKNGEVEDAEVMIRVDLPVEHLLLEVFVDQKIPISGTPRLSQFNLLTGGSGENSPDRERARMPIADQVQELRSDPRTWSTPVAPRHWEMVNDCMHWMSRRPADFRVYRVSMQWPLIPTAIVVSTQLGHRS